MNKQKWIAIARKTILALVVLAALWFAIVYIRKTIYIQQAIAQQASLTGDITDLEEYAVYSAVIENRYGFFTDTELILIQDHTGLGLLTLNNELKFVEELKSMKLLVGEPWQSDFSAKNDAPSALGRLFKLSRPYLFVTSDYTQGVALNRELHDLNIHYSSFLEFSRVGFNSVRDEAVVHCSFASLGHTNPGVTFEISKLIYLKKVDGVWKVVKEEQTAIT